MQINTNERSGTKSQGVFIDPHPKKEKEMLDKMGNVIDPRTKQSIRKAEDNK